MEESSEGDDPSPLGDVYPPGYRVGSSYDGRSGAGSLAATLLNNRLNVDPRSLLEAFELGGNAQPQGSKRTADYSHDQRGWNLVEYSPAWLAARAEPTHAAVEIPSYTSSEEETATSPAPTEVSEVIEPKAKKARKKRKVKGIEHNHDEGRPQAKTRNGELRYRYFFSKRTKEFSVAPVYVKKDYSFVDNIMLKIFENRETFEGSIKDSLTMELDDPRLIHSLRGLQDMPPKEELLERHKSRFD